jgi:hypothetical protein
MGLGAAWQPAELRKCAAALNAGELYVKPSSVLPNMVNWLLTGAVVIPTPGVYRLGRKNLEGRVGAGEGVAELVIGSYCPQTQKAHLFSGTHADQGLLPPGAIDTYLGSDWRAMTRAVIASAAVPHMVPPIRVMTNSRYTFQDGGLYAPSPWSSVWNHVIEFPGPVKIVYFVSTMTTPVLTFSMFEPLVALINSSSAREASDAVEAFQVRCRGRGLQTRSTAHEAAAEAAVAYTLASEAILIVRPYPDKDRYSFDLFGFKARNLLEIFDRFHALRYEVVAAI